MCAVQLFTYTHTHTLFTYLHKLVCIICSIHTHVYQHNYLYTNTCVRLHEKKCKVQSPNTRRVAAASCKIAFALSMARGTPEHNKCEKKETRSAEVSAKYVAGKVTDNYMRVCIQKWINT